MHVNFQGDDTLFQTSEWFFIPCSGLQCLKNLPHIPIYGITYKGVPLQVPLKLIRVDPRYKPMLYNCSFRLTAFLSKVAK